MIEPSSDFAKRVVNQVLLVEQQRYTRIMILFTIIALAPYALRELWSLFRGDYVSVIELPFGFILSQIYLAFMSSPATYALLAFGVVLAIYAVGLPQWRKAEFRSLK